MFLWWFHVLVLNGVISPFVNSIEIHKDNKEIAAVTEGSHFVLNKRGLIQFGLMIYCATGRSAFDFNGYGCWCGFGGKGSPVDDLDRCCRDHDLCYDNIRESKICPFDLAKYLMRYSRKGCTGCKPASSYWFYGKCRYTLCECDATAAKCFERAHYNQEFKNYPNKKCK